jgi:hypothetical protein
MPSKKAAPKKVAKKSAKKAVKKAPAKKAVKAVKKPVKKPTKKVSAKKPAPPKAVVIRPITDSTGVVTMKSVDDPGTASEGQPASVKPYLDKETGVLIMVPELDD